MWAFILTNILQLHNPNSEHASDNPKDEMCHVLSRALSFLPTLARSRFLLLAKMLLDELIHSLKRQGIDFVDVDLNLVWVGLYATHFIAVDVGSWSVNGSRILKTLGNC